MHSVSLHHQVLDENSNRVADIDKEKNNVSMK
jgi:hypothetical protein